MTEKSEKKYLIGDISKMTGIPLQTLRYYETRGILKPRRDKTSGYRYYSTWDTNDVFDLMILRDHHFSIDQIEALINSADSRQVEQMLDDNTAEIQNEIHKLNHSLKAISVLRENLQKTKHLYEYEIQQSPSLLFYLYRTESNVEDKKGSSDLKKLYEERKGWIDQIGNLTPTFLVHSLKPLHWYWGFSNIHNEVPEKIIKSKPDQLLNETRSLHTVFDAHDEGTFEEALKSVLKKAESMHEMITGQPYGTLLIKTHENHTFNRYFEIWIPVQNR